MHTKTQPDEIQSYLSDASNMQGGHATRVVFPETTEDVAAILAQASKEFIPITIAGAGTGVVGGRVPFGGIVLATDRLNKIVKIVREGEGGWAVAEAGVVLGDFQRAVAAKGLLYPPDPTEWSCFLGGTISTNASGARTFKYGPTRGYVRRLKIVLATGDVINLKRDEIFADSMGKFQISLPSGRTIDAQLPTYQMPKTRKHVAGYFVSPGMDVLDLFIGSEGTLGVITEVELDLLPRPVGLLSGVVFFKNERDLLAFVRDARSLSLQSRQSAGAIEIDPRALEYIDGKSLEFLRSDYPLIPQDAASAIFFEQETNAETDELLISAWQDLLEKHNALVDESWFATNEVDQKRLREFRHALPVLVNEWLSRHNQRKVSTDMAVPDDEFEGMLDFYKMKLVESKLQYVIFGHIGDNHVHVNILPSDDREAVRARDLYGQFIKRSVAVGGTISAEHGIGKLKRDYLATLYSEIQLEEMAVLKRMFDPAGILGQGNMFPGERSSTDSLLTRHWKRVALGCLAITLILASAIWWIQTGRIQKVRVNFERISPGQSREEVVALIGEPAKTLDCTTLGSSFSVEYIRSCDHVYSYSGGLDVWQVHLDKDGRVVGKIHRVSR